MWLYKILVTLCVIKITHLVSTSTPIDSNRRRPSGRSDGTDLGLHKDEYYTPVPDWSDTFDWRLLKAVSAGNSNNVLISPLSLKLALIMLYEGSAGATEKQFQSILQFPHEKSEIREKYKSILKALQENKKDHELNIGTRIFLESSIAPNQLYSATIKSAYGTDVYPTNFSHSFVASNTINSWVEILTKGHIKNLVTPENLSEDVLLFVANAIYFKGSWVEQFSKINTHSGGFYVSPTEVITVSYMATSGKYFAAESKELDAKILRLPYKGKQFAMYFVLPNSKGGLPDLINNINLASLKRQLYLMDNRTVDIVIPKFKFEFSTSFTKTLEDIGFNIMFSNAASFPGIARGVGSGTKWLFVNDIKQKAGIEVNEEGSEISVATSIEIGSKFGDSDINFNATHPFLIFVEEQKTGTIVFAGKIENPLQTDAVLLPSRFGDSNRPGMPAAPPSQVFNGNAQRPDYKPAIQDTDLQRSNYLDLELLRAFDESRNFFISPASIKVVLGMLLEGAKHKSAQELSTALRSSKSSARTVLEGLLEDLNASTNSTHVEAANCAFISNAIAVNPEYQRNLQKHYKANIRHVDYSDSVSSANLINSWVRNATHGWIKELVTPDYFSSETALILANALYFKGLWKVVFDERSTSIKCFRNHRKDCVNARMMQTSDMFNYTSIDYLHAQALQLLYSDEKYAMLILLPNEDQTIEGLTRDIQHHTFSSIVQQLQPNEVFVNIPRFEIDFSADIKSILQHVGIRQVFSENADLSGITEQNVMVSQVVHKAIVEVNENGTTAAASTEVNAVLLMGSTTARFIANHPFLFFIYQVESNNILFEGRFNEPSEVYDEIFTKPPYLQQAHKHRAPVKQQSPDQDALEQQSILFPLNTKTETNSYSSPPAQSSSFKTRNSGR